MGAVGMKYVYIDTFILENLIMNYVILHMTSRILRAKAKWYSMLAGAAIGTVCAVLSLWVESLFTALITKVIFSFFMILVSFVHLKEQSINQIAKSFIKALVTFYAVTFVFAGASFCMIMSGNIKNMARYIVGLSVAYLVITYFVKVVKSRCTDETYKTTICIDFDGKNKEEKWIPAIVDTGNSLKDPFTGKSVIVAEVDVLKNLLPTEILKFLNDTEEENILSLSGEICIGIKWENRFRIVPYSAVGKENGILMGFKADIIKIIKNTNCECQKKEREFITLNDTIICIYKNTLSKDGSYSALLAPDMVA